MKLIELSKHSEPKPYILKANYPLETKATYFKSKGNLIDSPQTQLLSYCVANGYTDIFDLKEDSLIKQVLDSLTNEQREDIYEDFLKYNYGEDFYLPKSLEISQNNKRFDLQVNKEDIKTLLFEETNNLYEFKDLDSFCSYLIDTVYNDDEIVAIIECNSDNQTKTHAFTDDGDIYFTDLYKAIKHILKNELLFYITDLSIDQEHNSCTITGPNKALTLTFSWAPYK